MHTEEQFIVNGSDNDGNLRPSEHAACTTETLLLPGGT